MKRLLLLCLISLVLSETVSDDDKGPAVHPKHSDSKIFCDEYFPWDKDSGNYYDDNSTNPIPQGVSDCVDTLLWNKHEERYYDRCCYMRYMKQGQMLGTCFGIRREEYTDIVDAIHNIEREGVHHLRWAGIEPRPNGIRFAPGDLHDHSAGIKIYELNCKSSYLQFALVFALLSFLF